MNLALIFFLQLFFSYLFNKNKNILKASTSSIILAIRYITWPNKTQHRYHSTVKVKVYLNKYNYPINTNQEENNES